MKAFILYRPNSEHERAVLDFLRDYKILRHDPPVDLMDADSLEGYSKMKAYDITNLPAVLAVEEDGQVLQLWQGLPLPSMNELDGYLIIH